MHQGNAIFSKGINRSLDPRHIADNEQYDAYNVEVVERGALSKRKGFNRWRTDAGAVFSDVVRGIFTMYGRDGSRYLFVFVDASPGTDLWIEEDGTDRGTIEDFFPSSGYRVRAAVFGNKIYFVNGQDRPRWYKEYDGSNHIWGIGGVPSPDRSPIDEGDFEYFISKAEYAECITSAEAQGIELPGIWRYKQTIGYYGKENDEQVEESNAGPASKMFHCQFNTDEALGTVLVGYIKKGIELGIADYDDLILDANESAGQDYEDFIRWMRLYRQWKMFSDEPYSSFELLTEMKKGWPTSIRDNFSRDSSVVAPTTKVSFPVSHHIEKVSNRLFVGRIEKELFSQPGLPIDFHGETDYEPDFTYRIPITITNTGAKTLTSAVMPLRFHDDDTYTTDKIASLPSGGGTWRGAYIKTSLDLSSTDWYQMVFVDEDGVTPLGYTCIAQDSVASGGDHDITFLIEIPEIAAGSTRTIYLYFEDSALDQDPDEGEPGHWTSLAHYPLCASDHWMLADFENWDSGIAFVDVTQKRSFGKLEQQVWTAANGGSRDTFSDVFFNTAAWAKASAPCFKVNSSDATERDAAIKFYPPDDSSSFFSVAFMANVSVGNTAGHAYVDLTKSDGTICIRFAFTRDATDAILTVTVYETDGTPRTITFNDTLNTHKVWDDDDWMYYILRIDGDEIEVDWIQGGQNGHPAEGSSWSTSDYNTGGTTIYTLANPVRLDSTGMYFGARVQGTGGNGSSSYVRFKEMQVLGRALTFGYPYNDAASYLNRDTYFPDHGLAVVGDMEEASGASEYPDRFYFSGLNTPNSFDATDFRDLGDRGFPIQGIKGVRNRVFVFTSKEIRALFPTGSEQALALESSDTKMWNLSHDLTGEIGGLGVFAPDTLIAMEFAGRDGVGFLSQRGFYFFDGQNFVHISECVDNLIRYHVDNYGKDFFAAFIKKKRQLLITPTDILDSSPRMQVANMMFVKDVDSIVWTEWGIPMKYGVELDEYLDDGDFVFLRPYYNVNDKAQVLKLDGNTGNSTHIDIKDDGAGDESTQNVTLGVQSKYFDLFDSEMIKCDLRMERNLGLTPATTLTLYADPTNIPGTPPTATVVMSNPRIGINRFPVGTNGIVFMFKIADTSASDLILERLNFFYNVHGERRLESG